MDENVKKKNAGLHSVMRIMGIVMSAIYILIGVAVFFRGQELFNIPPAYSWPLGSMMIAYGGFRGYRFFQRHYNS
jgi:hypothetical protein